MALITNNISGSSSGFSRIGITGSVVIGDAPQSAFPTPGSDAVFFVSGSESKKAVIGGAAKISGSLSADGNVVLGNAGEDTITVAGTPIFSMPATFNAGLSGSLTKLSDGTSYLIAGSNVIITTASNGSITIESSGGGGGGGGAPTGALYVTLATNASLTDERVLTAGNGIAIVDGGAGGTVTISTTNGTGADPNAQYLVLSSTGSLNNERTFSAGTGLVGTDDGANSNYVLSISDSIVATISGSTFTGNINARGTGNQFNVLTVTGSIFGNGLNVNQGAFIGGALGVSGISTFTGATTHNAGLSGSLTKLVDGTSYLIAGNGMVISTGSTGAVTIARVGSIDGDITGVTAGTGLTGGGTSGTVSLAINDSVVATISGTQFTGPISSTGFTLTDRVLITSGSSRTISQSNMVWDSTNNYLGFGHGDSRKKFKR